MRDYVFTSYDTGETLPVSAMPTDLICHLLEGNFDCAPEVSHDAHVER